mmetsp:Transcript_16289/g.36115  ORF Transcript_16289/g.36115 Transcript_16289/m.36115 type:complete len:202 (-) Transcript_16289:265-870(-)
MAGDRRSNWPINAIRHPIASTTKLNPSFGRIRVLLSSLMMTNVRAVSLSTIPDTPTTAGFLAPRTAILLPSKSADSTAAATSWARAPMLHRPPKYSFHISCNGMNNSKSCGISFATGGNLCVPVRLRPAFGFNLPADRDDCRFKIKLLLSINFSAGSNGATTCANWATACSCCNCRSASPAREANKTCCLKTPITKPSEKT